MARVTRKRIFRWAGWLLLGLLAVLGFLFARWGRPLAVSYSIRATDASEWVVERTVEPRVSWRALDINGDGVIDEFRSASAEFQRPATLDAPKRWLIICLDGVPLASAKRLWAGGRFREFHPPSAAIGSFPSESETAMTEALRAAQVPGYENHYFDRRANALRGGVWTTLRSEGAPYLKLLDYETSGWSRALHFVFVRKSFRADLRALRENFRASKQEIFHARMATADAVYHILPGDEADELIVELESLIRELYLDARGELGILIYSDHGNTLVRGQMSPVRESLEERGWRLSGALDGPREVVIPAYGLLGFLAIYCQPESFASLADDLAGIETVELVAHRAGENSLRLRGPGGSRAQLKWSEGGERYWYSAEAGDPLRLAPVFQALRLAGKLGDDGSAADADLFAATSRAYFPDAAARLRAWAINHVRNPSDLIVSLQREYFHGAGGFDRLVTMKSTHGALEATSTLGFALSTLALPSTVRLADLIPPQLLKPQMHTDSNK